MEEEVLVLIYAMEQQFVPALTFQTVAADPVTNPDGLDTDDFRDGARLSRQEQHITYPVAK